MPLELKRNGSLNYRALTRAEGELLAGFLDLQIDRWVKELSSAKAMDLLEENPAKRGKQAAYADHACKAFRQVLAVLLQSMRLSGLLKHAQAITTQCESGGGGTLDFGDA